MTWLPGPADRPSTWNIPSRLRQQPFNPRLPAAIPDNPLILGLAMGSLGIVLSVTIVTTMHRWPAWMLMPSMAIAVVAMAATAVGSSIVVAAMMQPVIASRENLNWSETPLSVLGISLQLQKQCQGLGYWTCESVGRAVESGTFPWTEFGFDERRQLHGSISHWQGSQEYGDNR
ncbi:MAG: hypothetical protein ACOC9Y_07580 [Chloroflexota bacterium]